MLFMYVLILHIAGVTGDYELRFETGNLTNSGTTAQVYYALEGTLGNISITNATGGNFSLDGRATVTHAGDYGIFGIVTIGHDGSGTSPDWYLYHFEIEDLTRLITYIFPCECWITAGNPTTPTWPIAGTWLEWSEWTRCDYETLERSRSRECVVEYPQYGGTCDGDAEETPYCSPVEWTAPYTLEDNILDTDLSVCLPLNEPTRNNFVHVANITKETNVSSDVTISLTTTMAYPNELCNETGMVVTHQSQKWCPSAIFTTCNLLGPGSVNNSLLLCDYECPCNGFDCVYGLYYEQFRHYIAGYGINENVRELCKIGIVQYF